MKQTAVEWLVNKLNNDFGNNDFLISYANEISQAKQREKQDMENKAIHFAEWLTNKHTLALMSLYEHFEEQYYNETFNK